MTEAMKIARFAAERCECWAQSFVRARPKREVGMSDERIRWDETAGLAYSYAIRNAFKDAQRRPANEEG